MSEKRPKSFVLYADFEEALLNLSMNERGMLFTMIYSYANRGTVDSFERKTRRVDMAFAIIRPQLDRDREKYQRICERNAENGSFGGRPKTQKTQWVSEKPKKAYNNNNNNNNNNNYSDNNNKSGIERSFDPGDFFAAALARSYGEEIEKEEKEKKEENSLSGNT